MSRIVAGRIKPLGPLLRLLLRRPAELLQRDLGGALAAQEHRTERRAHPRQAVRRTDRHSRDDDARIREARVLDDGVLGLFDPPPPFAAAMSLERACGPGVT